MELKKRKDNVGWGIILTSLVVTGFIMYIWHMTIDVYLERLHQKFQNITLYDNSGQIVGQWTGDFSVTRNGDTTQIKNAERVIEITGGIVIAEGN